MTYTAAALVGVAASVLLDLEVLRTRLVASRLFWLAYAVVLVFQLVSNAVLAGGDVVLYRPSAVLGPRLAGAPVEDLLFGFALVLQSLAWWEWWGGYLDRKARSSPGPATRARRAGPTETRRSSTR